LRNWLNYLKVEEVVEEVVEEMVEETAELPALKS